MRIVNATRANLVLLEKHLDTAGKALDNLALVVHHLLQVVLNAGDGDTVVSEILLGVLQEVGGVQQSLGRNATNVQASATKTSARLNASSLKNCQMSDF